MKETTLKKFHLRKAYSIYRNIKWSFFDHSLVRKDIVYRLINHYGGDSGHKIETPSGNLGFGFIHYCIIRNIRPAKVLCIGSRMGFVPAICALACKDNRYGVVEFVDAGLDESDKKSWSGIGFWKKTDLKKHFNVSKLNNWINTYIMTSQSFADAYPKWKYDYIYIDGDHSYGGVKLDFKLFWPRLNKNGFMVFHDATVKNWGSLKGFGVWKFLKENKNRHKIIFPLNESGLAILQK